MNYAPMRILGLALCVFVLPACGDDEDDAMMCVENLTTLGNNYSTALNTWLADPENVELCMDAQESANTYVSEISGYLDCLDDAGININASDRAAWESLEQDLEDSENNFDCDNL